MPRAASARGAPALYGRPCTLEQAIADAPKLVERAAEDAMRMVGVGIALENRKVNCLPLAA